ncbi:MAG: hypothetical protein RLZZ227_3156 [Pseudomonadota bacterium]|jgi:hypothetical protein
MTAREKLGPHDPSDTDDPPNYIEGNDPEDALADTDPDESILDHQNPDAGVKEAESDDLDKRSPY